LEGNAPFAITPGPDLADESRMRINPFQEVMMPKHAATIHHDCLFKWLLQAFMPEFFAHYFPDTNVRSIRFLDKEFLKKL
jgi:hypothetical protein